MSEKLEVVPPRPDDRYPEFNDAIIEVRAAEAQGSPWPRCIECGHIGFYYPADKAYIEGHIYSQAGYDEFSKISCCCEWCFDKMFAESAEE